MAKHKFTCRKCGVSIQVFPEFIGKNVECQSCGAEVVVPTAQEELAHLGRAREQEQLRAKEERRAQAAESRPRAKGGLTRCEVCGKEVAEEARTCPHCGARGPKALKEQRETEEQELEEKQYKQELQEAKEEEDRQTKKKTAIVAVVVGIVVIGIVWGNWSTLSDSGHGGGSRPDAGGSGSQTQRAWYEGGSLHGAGAQEWCRASYANRLATSADFATTLLKESGKTITSVEQIRPYAQQLEAAISGVAAEIADGPDGGMKVSRIAATHWVLINR